MAIEPPIEIIDAILDKLDRGDRRSLIATSVLNSKWRTPSQQRIFREIALTEPFRFEKLFHSLNNSPFLARMVKEIAIGITHPLNWFLHPPSANTAAAILDLLPNVRSLRLENGEGQADVRWVWVSLKLKHAIEKILASDRLEELVVDWWEFELPADVAYRMLVASPSLKRLTLNMPLVRLLPPLSNVHGAHETVLDLDYLKIKPDTDPDSQQPAGGAFEDDLKDFIPPFAVTSTKGLVFDTVFEMANHCRFRGWMSHLKAMIGPVTTELVLAGRSAVPFDLSPFTRLESLRMMVDFSHWSPNTDVTKATLETANSQDTLSFIRFLSLVDSPASILCIKGLLSMLSSKRFPRLGTVKIDCVVLANSATLVPEITSLVENDSRLKKETFSVIARAIA